MIWKDIKDWEGYYQISDEGIVRSLGRVVNKKNGRPQNVKSRELKPGIVSSGYLMVGLRKEGKCKMQLIHRLVAQAFIPNPENKRTVNHKDGDKKNNKLSNLEWMTYSENIRHSFAMGMSTSEHVRGSSNGMSKLDEHKVYAIRLALSKGVAGSILSGIYNVSNGTISLIKNSIIWKHVKLV